MASNLALAYLLTDGDLMKDLRHMLPCWRWTTDSYIRSFVPTP